MFLNRLKAIVDYLFGRHRRLALCPIRARVLQRTLLFAAVALSARMSAASVLATGDFTPADNPFTTTINEGMPTDGNFVNPFEAANHQTYFEGRHTDGANAADPTDDTNVNFDVKVGITSSGTLLISGE